MTTMKKTLFVSALVLSASAAFAGAKLEMVTNYKNVTYGKDYLDADASKANHSTTQVDRLRLGVSGKATDALSASARFDFKSAVAAATTYNGVGGSSSGIVDFAVLDYTVMPGLVFTMGKLGAKSGGQEQQYSGADVYFYSTVNGDKTSVGFGGAGGAAGGFGVAYTAGDHKFTFQNLNDPNSASQTGSATEQGATRGAAILDYTGNFMENKLNLNVWNKSYKSGDLARTATVLGVKYDFGAAVLDFDFVTASKDVTSSTKNEATGQIVNVAVPVGDLKYLAKFETTQDKVAGEKNNTFTNFGVAAQWNLTPDASSHLHAAYNVLSYKGAAAGAKDMAENQLQVGFKAFVDILK